MVLLLLRAPFPFPIVHVSPYNFFYIMESFLRVSQLSRDGQVGWRMNEYANNIKGRVPSSSSSRCTPSEKETLWRYLCLHTVQNVHIEVIGKRVQSSASPSHTSREPVVGQLRQTFSSRKPVCCAKQEKPKPSYQKHHHTLRSAMLCT